MNVRRRRLEVTTVSGPVGTDIVCLTYLRIKAFDESCLAYAWGSDDAHNNGGELLREDDQRGGRGVRFSLSWSCQKLSFVEDNGLNTSVERTACFRSLPGAAYAKALGFGPPECGFFSLAGL